MRQREFLSPGENAMAKANLARMNVESLLDLRDQVDQRLRQHRGELQEQLEKIASLTGERAVRGRGASTLRARKVAPKYRSLSGETWAGRGARPRWLVAAIKEGKKLASGQR
jgi:DNA-binding protein H-NS